MAKRDRRHRGAPKSNERQAKKRAVKAPADVHSSAPEKDAKLSPSHHSAAAKRSSASVDLERGRPRTAPPSPFSGELEEIQGDSRRWRRPDGPRGSGSDRRARASRRAGGGPGSLAPMPAKLAAGQVRPHRAGAQRATTAAAPEAGVAARHAGVRRTGVRTPLPPPIAGELEEINLGGARAKANARNRAPGAGAERRRQRAADQGVRFQHLQDYLHNPNLFDLRGQTFDTSSTPEEIETRTGEVRYQIEVIRSLMTVLTEELETLEKARPRRRAEG